MITNHPSRLGDLKRFSVIVFSENGESYNLRNAVLELHIWQDILSPTWSAQILISDTSNFIHQIPLKQGTRFEITLETELENPYTDGVKKYNLVLYRISDRNLIKSRHQTYIVHLIDENFIKNQTKRIQKHFDDDPASIVSSVISEHLGGSVDVEKANNKVNIIIPNMSPITCAQWMSKMAVGKEGASFLFFMSDENRYTFKSIYTLYTDKKYNSKLQLIQRISNMSPNEGDKGSTPKNNILAIQHYSIEHYDGLMNISNGYFGSQVCWYDFIRKKFDKKERKFESSTGDFNLDISKSNISFVPRSEKLFDGPNIFESVEEWHSTRKRNAMLLSQDKVFVQLPGGGRYWEYLGYHCTLDLSSQEDITHEQFDRYYRGKYLITAIEHVVKDQKYFVNLELVKLKYERSM